MDTPHTRVSADLRRMRRVGGRHVRSGVAARLEAVNTTFRSR
jgi:hypothetical protein